MEQRGRGGGHPAAPHHVGPFADKGRRIDGLILSGTVSEPSFRYSRLWHTLGWLMVATVIALSISPKAPSVLDVPGGDKLDHVLAYLTLMFWFCQLYSEPRRRLWIGTGFFALAGCLELVQGLLVFRTADLADALANGAGILVGWSMAKTRLGELLSYVDGRLLRLVNKPGH